jgi:Rrf2 family iron-sulfur cluster assembly transcriptional regulator
MAMVDLAKYSDKKPIPLAEIATRQEISLSYLEQLFSKLRRAGLVKSVRGPGGGYRLAFGTESIRISDVIHAVDEPIKVTRCDPERREECLSKHSRCLTHDLWVELGRQIDLFLSSVTLEDVCEGRVLDTSRIFPPETAADMAAQ